MNVGSLFSGVGGFDLGLERAGHRVVFQCEADAWRREVLAHHWPGIPLSPDVREVTTDWYRGELSNALARDGGSNEGVRPGDLQPSGEAALNLDLVCGGFPCQDLSVAGKRAGLAGERSGLFFEAARVADAFLGSGGWLLIENVPGLLSSNGGRDFGIVLATLGDLGFYDLAWRVLDSRYFGVPQRRRRVFILARRARGRHAAEVLLEPESGGGDFEASEKAKKNTSGGPRQGTPVVASALDKRRGGADDNDAQARHLVTGKCLTTSQERLDYETQDFILSEGVHSEHEGRGSLHRAGGRGGSHGSAEPAGNEADELHSPTGTDSRGSEADPDRVREAAGVSGRMDDSPQVTAFHATQSPITSESHSPALGKSAQIGVSIRTAQTGANGWGIRMDEVGTLDRAMGQAVYSPGRDANTSPVDYAPDGPRYAAMGDAVTVNVAEWIGRRLMEYGG